MQREDLYQKFPELFRQTKLGRNESCMYYGIQCGRGWFQLIHDMSEELDAIGGIEYSQIKEKFAVLRVYLDYTKELSEEDETKVHEIIRKYEELSSNTCEFTGKPGKRWTSEFGWMKTLCDEEIAKLEAKQKDDDVNE